MTFTIAGDAVVRDVGVGGERKARCRDGGIDGDGAQVHGVADVAGDIGLTDLHRAIGIDCLRRE
ncbi:hypothetical protein [Cobetia sp. ICG0124]|uniref:hypothetical protein n=1 Tax=Cobetia sp. ICG0124 TaxID=2053669 RepID=UPI000FDBD483|nr:hypothetical protein [Cobetia sp. ICG0124]